MSNDVNKKYVFLWLLNAIGLVCIILFFIFFLPSLYAVGIGSGMLRIIILALLGIFGFMLSIIFIVRTISLVMYVFFPTKSAKSIIFNSQEILVTLDEGKINRYEWKNIKGIDM